MNFHKLDGEYFWSTGYAYGVLMQSGNDKKRKVTLKVLNGKINLDQFVLNGLLLS